MRARIAMIAIAVFVAVAALAGKPAPPPPTGPWDLVYASQTNNTGDLTLMQADGAGKYVVYVAPDHPFYPRFPDWSHDGKYVSFHLHNIQGHVLQVATRKSCLLYGSHGTSPQSMEFHPSFGEGVGDGRYLVAYTNWNNVDYDLYFTEFKFRDGDCEILRSENVSGSDSRGGEWGAAWSPVGTARATQLATVRNVLDEGLYVADLRIYDIVMDANGHLVQAGTFVDYPLDRSLYFTFSYGCRSGCSIQWSPNPNVLGIVAAWSPDGGATKYWDVYSIDISTNPPVMTNLTNTPIEDYFFDFRTGGDEIIVGNSEGIWRYPADGDPVKIAPLERRKWPRDPAWNPTRP